MTREKFAEHKAQLKRTMEYQLSLSKVYNKPLSNYCGYTDVKTITLNENDTEQDLRDKLLEIAIFMQYDNTTLTQSGHTRASGRYDFFDHVNYNFNTIRVRDELPDQAVEEAMKQLVKRHLGLKPYEHLECKVMQLFKEGIIEWADVIEAHKGDCEI